MTIGAITILYLIGGIVWGMYAGIQRDAKGVCGPILGFMFFNVLCWPICAFLHLFGIRVEP
jgi:hypothetical protein